MATKTCDHCGKQYTSASQNQRWCSGECRQAAWRKTNKGSAKPGRPKKRRPFAEELAEDLGLWGLLTTRQQQAVARGDVSLDAMLEVVTRRDTDELCPACCVRTIDPKSPLGFCRVCTVKRSSETHRQVVAEQEAQRENNEMKKRVQRAREANGTNPRKGPSRPAPCDFDRLSKDHGRAFLSSDEPLPLPKCETCGKTFRQHHDTDTLCVDCQELADRRQAVTALETESEAGARLPERGEARL